MSCSKRSRVLFAFLFSVGISGLFAADQPAGFSRRILVDQDLATAGKHGLIALIEFAPGAVAPKHTHPGEEMLYVLEGNVHLEIDGQSPRELKAGDAVVIPAGAGHLGHNSGTVTVRILSSYFLDKGQPLATPAK